MNYVYHSMEADADALAMAITPHEMVINLRDQASRSVKEQTMYEPTRVGNFISWPDVQQTRVNAIAAFNALVNPSWKQRLTALSQVVMIAFMSLLPPDRVGVVRRLRFKHTLVRRESGGWRLDLSSRKDGHSTRARRPRREAPSLKAEPPQTESDARRGLRLAETSKHYGPYCTALPDALTPLLNRYADALALEGEGGDEAYLFGPNHALDRPYESASWSMAVKRAFAKHSPGGREVAPKTLRASFM